MIRGTASQASALGSIPIARSINLVDSVALPLLKTRKWSQFAQVLYPTWPQLFSNRRPVGHDQKDISQRTHSFL